MEHIFDDDRIEIGAELDAYCTRCKVNTTHTVLTKFEEEIRSVHCNTCNTTHAYRPPRGDPDDEIPEPITVRRRQTMRKLTWQAGMGELDTSRPRPYSPRDKFREEEVIQHPTFGMGFVSEILSDTKLEATFQDGTRILAFDRQDLVIKGPKKRAPEKKAPPSAAVRNTGPGGGAPRPGRAAPAEREHAAARSQRSGQARRPRPARAGARAAARPVRQKTRPRRPTTASAKTATKTVARAPTAKAAASRKVSRAARAAASKSARRPVKAGAKSAGTGKAPSRRHPAAAKKKQRSSRR